MSITVDQVGVGAVVGVENDIEINGVVIKTVTEVELLVKTVKNFVFGEEKRLFLKLKFLF
jgi:hypothetical protein